MMEWVAQLDLSRSQAGAHKLNQKTRSLTLTFQGAEG